MSSIEQLIKMKRNAQNDDILTVIAELSTYDKLSKSKSFQNIHDSLTMQKRLPFIWAAMQNDLYAKSLLVLAGNIITHVTEGRIPEIIHTCIDNVTDTQLKRVTLMQKYAATVNYHTLYEYNHEQSEDNVVGVYTQKLKNSHHVAIIIIVRDTNNYEIYHGHYESISNTKEKATVGIKTKAFILTQGDKTIEIETYSIQGNNAYPFAVVTTPKDKYSLMIPTYDKLWIYPHSLIPLGKTFSMYTVEPKEIELDIIKRNTLNMVKNDIASFSNALLDIITEVEDDEET